MGKKDYDTNLDQINLAREDPVLYKVLNEYQQHNYLDDLRPKGKKFNERSPLGNELSINYQIENIQACLIFELGLDSLRITPNFPNLLHGPFSFASLNPKQGQQKNTIDFYVIAFEPYLYGEVLISGVSDQWIAEILKRGAFVKEIELAIQRKNQLLDEYRTSSDCNNKRDILRTCTHSVETLCLEHLIGEK
ncbi:MAG: hypothetical protein PHG05_03400 [Candidatus Nanoarchaeia archaeon]|nr:hypothetical protein [Candidatus Nanoarchaeia archaeon]